MIYYWFMERFSALARVMLMAWLVLLSISFLPSRSLIEYWSLALTVVIGLSWLVTLGYTDNIKMKYFVPGGIREGIPFKLKILLAKEIPSKGSKIHAMFGFLTMFRLTKLKQKSNAMSEPSSIPKFDAMSEYKSKSESILQRKKNSLYSATAFRVHEAFTIKNNELEWTTISQDSNSEIKLKFIPRLRGCYPIHGLSVIKNQAWGFLYKSGFRLDEKNILVWAKYIEIPQDYIFNLINSYKSLAISSSQQDFVGVREYQTGDRMRDLHHRTWAKKGEPYTKIFEAPQSAQITLMIDAAQQDLKKRYLWEPFLQICSAMGNKLIEQNLVAGYLVGKEDFISNRNEELKVEWDNAIARLPIAAFKKMVDLSIGIPKEYEINLVFSCGKSLKWINYLKEKEQNTSLKVIRLVDHADEYMILDNLITITFAQYLEFKENLL